MTLLLVALAGAVGAPVRFVLDAWLDDRIEGAFPWGTLAVNVVGSLGLGVVAGLSRAGVLAHRPTVVIGAGFCGALTTFSTHAVESVRLGEDGARRLALLNVGGTLLVCLLAAGAGFGIASLG